MRTRSKTTKDLAWRIIISRSNRFLSAQLVEPHTGQVKLGGADYKRIAIEAKSNKSDRAGNFGKWFGNAMAKIKVDKIVFDRNGYRYHGRIRSFAEGLRSVGIKI